MFWALDYQKSLSMAVQISKLSYYNKRKLIYRLNKLFLQYLSWTVKRVKYEYLNLYNVQQQTLIYQKSLTNIKINVI